MNRAKFAAAAAAVLIGGAATAALAHPHSDGEKVEKRVIVITDADHKGGKGEKGEKIRRFHVERIDGDGKGGHPRMLRVGRDGKGVHLGHLADCEGGDKLVDESAGDDKSKTKVIICSKGGDKASRGERLERALARIEANEHLEAEHKSRIAASLRDAIEKERSGR